MPVDIRILVGEITAGLAKAQLVRRGGLGVFIENMPALDASALIAMDDLNLMILVLLVPLSQLLQ